MWYLYTIGIKLYGFFLYILSRFHPKAKLWIEGRKDKKNLYTQLNKYKNGILFHCSSLGEYEQGKPLLVALKKKYPNKKIVLTFFSPSGYIPNKDNKLADYVCYLPLDTKKNTDKFVQALNPEFCFFVKYEFWPNLLRSLKNNKSKTYLVSSIFRKDQIFFKPYGFWYRDILKMVNHFYVQNTESEKLLQNIGLTNSTIVGDTRLDQVLKVRDLEFEESIFTDFIQNNKNVIVAGSTWLEDEILLSNFLTKNKDIKLILAPHEITENHIKKLQNIFTEQSVCFYTKNPNKSNLANASVLIVDTIGKLKFLYRYATIAYIGGGFGAGIHNTLEAVVYGKPVCFGPNYKKFQEAHDLLHLGIAKTVTKETFLLTLSTMLNSVYISESQENINNYIRKNKGAVHKIIESL